MGSMKYFNFLLFDSLHLLFGTLLLDFRFWLRFSGALVLELYILTYRHACQGLLLACSLILLRLNMDSSILWCFKLPLSLSVLLNRRFLLLALSATLVNQVV